MLMLICSILTIVYSDLWRWLHQNWLCSELHLDAQTYGSVREAFRMAGYMYLAGWCIAAGHVSGVLLGNSRADTSLPRRGLVCSSVPLGNYQAFGEKRPKFQVMWGRAAWISQCHPSLHDKNCVNVGLIMAHRLRRWTNIKPTLVERLVSTGMSVRKLSSAYL